MWLSYWTLPYNPIFDTPSESPSHSPVYCVSFAPPPPTDHSGEGNGAPSSKDGKRPALFQRSLKSPRGPVSLCPISPVPHVSFAPLPTDHFGGATKRPRQKTERGPDSAALPVRLCMAQQVSVPLSCQPRLFLPPRRIILEGQQSVFSSNEGMLPAGRHVPPISLPVSFRAY